MAGPAYQWGHWRFEPTEGRLLRDGEVVALPAKTLDLLATLLNRAPRLITKEEIMSRVWADAVVEEGNIAFHVAALRKVLDEGSGISAIETVRGRGYRFVHELSIHQLPPTETLRRDAIERAITESAPIKATIAAPIAPPAPSPPAVVEPAAGAPALPQARGNPRWVINGVLVLVIIALAVVVWRQTHPAALTIAIQQFEIEDPPAGQENFPDGLRAYLSAKMAIAGIETAEPNKAGAILSGQLRPRNGGFEVTVQLTRIEDGERIWDWSFDIPADADMPTSGQDDARSRLQGAIATRAAEGLANYLNLSGSVPVTR
ncbi:MAG: transcriptional regulator [Acidimicrobiia bacterium]